MNALKTNKFKVGDKVQVIEDNCTEEWFTVDDQYIVGVVVQVNPEDKEDRYYVKIKGFKGVYDEGCFAFNDEHLKLIEACETVSEQCECVVITSLLCVSSHVANHTFVYSVHVVIKEILCDIN